MHSDDVAKAAFVVPFGLFEFTRLPFESTNAPATFQRLMQRCLGDRFYSSVLIYLDDIIVYSPDFDSHLQHLDEVFTRLRAYGLKLKPAKCHLLEDEVQYLGHRVSATGVSIDPSKISIVQEWPDLGTVKDVRAFLGLQASFDDLAGYTMIVAPLFRYLRGTSSKKKRQEEGDSPSINQS